MNNLTEWTLNANREHLKQLLHDADNNRQLRDALGSWRHQLAQTLQAWAKKLEPELELRHSKQLA
jgi:hypothetical protein